jgi:UTP--glucose-1-phosphate uridylyltransferase
MAVIGRYIVSPHIMELLDRTKPGANGEIQLTDALRSLCQQEKVLGFKFEGTRFDVGDKMGFLQANVSFALNNSEFSTEFKEFLGREIIRMNTGA